MPLLLWLLGVPLSLVVILMLFGVVGFSFAGRGQNMGIGFVRLKDYWLNLGCPDDIPLIRKFLSGRYE